LTAGVTGFRPIAALRNLYAGRRLVLCTLLGVLVFLAAPETLRLPLRAALAWVVGVTLFLGLTLLAVGDASPERLKRRAQRQDSRGWVILAIIVIASAVSLAALGFVLEKGQETGALALGLRIGLAGLSVVASWLLTHTTFALRYAHYYYGDPGKRGGPVRGGLAFPGGHNPDYWDFFYFSFVVGMTCQVSDVQVTSRPMRRLTLAHGVLSFFFNTGVLALAVNILASALQ